MMPALLASIRKFSAYCTDFKWLWPAGCLIPIPHPLSIALNGPRTENDPTLHEIYGSPPPQAPFPDGWITMIFVLAYMGFMPPIDVPRKGYTLILIMKIYAVGWPKSMLLLPKPLLCSPVPLVEHEIANMHFC
jgi:hypothetical protein